MVLALHLEKDDRAKGERDAGQHLIRDAKQWPQGVDSTKGIDDALVQEVTPGRHCQSRADQVVCPRFGCFERGDTLPIRS